MPASTIARRVASFKANGGNVRPCRIVGDVTQYKCGKCLQWKPASGFAKNNTKKLLTRLMTKCKACNNSLSTKHRRENPDKYRPKRVQYEAARRARIAGQGGTVTPAELEALTEILGTTCLKCSSGKALQWDHIVPLAHGGRHEPQNLQRLCRCCNEKKQASTADYRTPEQIAAVAATFKRLIA